MFKRISFVLISILLILFSLPYISYAQDYHIPITDSGIVDGGIYGSNNLSGYYYDSAHISGLICNQPQWGEACDYITGEVDNASWGVSTQWVAGDGLERGRPSRGMIYYGDNIASIQYYDDHYSDGGSGLYSYSKRFYYYISDYPTFSQNSHSEQIGEHNGNPLYLVIQHDNFYNSYNISGLNYNPPGSSNLWAETYAWYTNYDVIYPPDYNGEHIPSVVSPTNRFESFSNITISENRVRFVLQNPSTLGVKLEPGFSLRYRLYDGDDNLIYEKSLNRDQWKGGWQEVDLSDYDHQVLRLETYLYYSPPGVPPEGVQIISPVNQMIDYNGSTYVILGGSNIDGCTGDFCAVPDHANDSGGLDPYSPFVKAISGGPLTDIVMLPLSLTSAVMATFTNSYCHPTNFNIPFHNTDLKITAECMSVVYDRIGITWLIELFGSILSSIIIYNTYMWFAKYIDGVLSMKDSPNSAGIWDGV